MARQMLEDGCFRDGTGSQEDQLDLMEWLADEEYAAEREAMFRVPPARPTIAPAPAQPARPVLTLEVSPAAPWMRDPYLMPEQLAGQHRRTA